MEIKFIGTGSGKTSLKRFHSSILIKSENTNLLIDAGEGVSKALLASDEKFEMIDVIYFTHYHADHFAGIASLITQMKLINRRRPLRLITHKNLIDPLENILKYSYLFEEVMDFELEITGFISDEPVQIDKNLRITAKQNSHIRNKYNFEVPKDSVFYSASMLIEFPGGNIYYSSDVGSSDDFYLFENENFDLAILETTHVSPGDLSEFLQRNLLTKIILTHIDDNALGSLEKWHKSLPAESAERVSIAEDGSSFYI